MAMYDVECLSVEPVLTAVVRRRAKQSELSVVVPKACGEVWNFIRASGIKGAGRHVALYLGNGSDVEIGAEVPAPFEGNGEVHCSSTPAGTVATTFHLGPYNALHKAHDAIHCWCRENNRSFAGPSWEVYGHWTDDLTKLRTDVFYLLTE